MEIINYLYQAVLFLFVIFILTSLIKNKPIAGIIAFICTIFSSVSLFYLSFEIFINNKVIKEELFSLKPIINSSLQLNIDSLSALFLIVIALISMSVTMFSWRYLKAYNQSSVRFYPFILLLFIACVGLVCVSDMLFFIILWEMMTLTSWFLLLFEKEKPSALKGGLQYFIATHITTGFLILASLILYSGSHDFAFAEIKNIFNLLIVNNPVLSHFIIFCVFLAFITKAGALPFGFWLPNTYPEPPSSASSFFGGIMSKLGVYAILRFFFSILPLSSHTEIWGFILALTGVFSIFIGTLAALTQDEAKRLMSFHAIGQVGYMLLGIGIGLYFITTHPFLGAISLVGGIFHIFNNSIYKSLLFLNAGSIYYQTGTTDLNKVSGLMKIMPLTAIAALIGSLSIAGVPPFNGFVSKLLIFESSIWSANESGVSFLIKFIFINFGIISIFISAVTLASFLKFVNSAFMGKLQGVKNSTVKLPFSMTFPQVFLSLICIFLGFFPIIPLKLIYISVSDSLNIKLPEFSQVFMTSYLGFGINFCEKCFAGTWFPIMILIPLILLCLLIFGFERYADVKKRIVETWYGGKEHTPEEVIYTGHSFYQPFKKLVSFKIGDIQFKGFYPVNLPSFKFSLPKWFIKILQPDSWFYYPFTHKIFDLFEHSQQVYQRMIKKYILWLIFGSLLIFILVMYLYEGKL